MLVLSAEVTDVESCYGIHVFSFVVCTMSFVLLLSHVYGLFPVHLEHSYDGTNVVLYRIYVLLKSHQKNFFSLSLICLGAVMAF